MKSSSHRPSKFYVLFYFLKIKGDLGQSNSFYAIKAEPDKRRDTDGCMWTLFLGLKLRLAIGFFRDCLKI